MKGRGFASGAGAQIESFVRSRSAAGSLCDGYLATLRIFDGMCARRFPEASELTQEMVDEWCERRPTEQPNTCRARCWPVISLVSFLRSRGETDVRQPELPRAADTGYSPHYFTDDELARFFAECDGWTPSRGPRDVAERNAKTVPVLFRLLYSSGIRTCEARLLRRDLVDLRAGVLTIAEGKGRSERVVALHPSMRDLMERYDAIMEGQLPGRTYFFPNGRDGHLTANWLCRCFRILWGRVSDERASAYQLRHAYAIRNIDRIPTGGAEGMRRLEYLSKSMGHGSVEVTVGSYYHITPSLAGILQLRCGDAFDRIVPEAGR